jgi:hypothetical protein
VGEMWWWKASRTEGSREKTARRKEKRKGTTAGRDRQRETSGVAVPVIDLWS